MSKKIYWANETVGWIYDGNTQQRTNRTKRQEVANNKKAGQAKAKKRKPGKDPYK